MPPGKVTAVSMDVLWSVGSVKDSGSTSIESFWSRIMLPLMRFGGGDRRVDDAFDSVEMTDELISDV